MTRPRRSDRPHAGFLCVPREWIAMVERGDLTPDQLAVAILIASEANHTSATEVVGKDGRRYRVEVGEALVGRRSLAERYHLARGGRDRVNRTIIRGAALGIWTTSAADAAPSPAPSSAPPRAPPPTLVTFRNGAEILFPALKPAPPAAPPPAPGPAPIQQENKGTRDRSLPSPAAPAGSRPRSRDAKHPDPGHRPLVELLVASFLEVRGVTYGFHGGKDGKAITDLLRVSGGDAAEVDRRWRRALALERFPGCASLSVLASRWNELAPTDGRANGRPARNGPMPPSLNFTRTLEDTGP